MGSIGNELRRVVPGGVKGALAGLLPAFNAYSTDVASNLASTG